MKDFGNTFRDALRAGQTRIGLWVGLADANSAELLATCGFDWLLFDGEHAPNDVRTVLEQLRAVAPYPVHPVVRPVNGETSLIKQYLDVGAQTLLVPMVDTAEQAEQIVRAMRYAPEGIRGMGAALARASRWNQIEDYVNRANDEMCLLVQAETTLAIRNLRTIVEVDGVDGVFFGPADLSASMGLRGQPNHPDVQQTILDGINTVRAAGKAAGVLMANQQVAEMYLDAGAQFVAVGVDTTLLVQAASSLSQRFKQKNIQTSDRGTSSAGVY
ncbi:4-hydroxy-2-oxoheptanedioate aldolase [Paraburkholderia sabiae]|uniref:4-hydroxy-2-oxoheptanedioate aldolase n=1 Tax=Paraburkholderia sabiae TaxID=273251 RepID=A0ABU9QKV1_9BURK|nr:4-hydroxy-2-oxoheptanedioate aldolase [Paraburkholderia sabiae]WJZ76494.1 4-hydroxy-2-oxoheptanedioate aldolase [Paraburkholderia sabiae]CAD6560234.1 4-hydroxy-2-oxo-heptane-1,7-dioate aldolase [Paraburkholderia sabiae]